MILPSKDLLSEVLRVQLVKYVEFSGETNMISYHDFSDEINIYELMHKMKEWAKLKFSYLLYSASDICIIKTFSTEVVEVFIDADTEFEAVTQACEWILKEVKSS